MYTCKALKGGANLDTQLKCKKHPKYQAIRKPTADCEPCRLMFRDAENHR